MRIGLLLCLFFFLNDVHAQRGMIFIKKNGLKKVATYHEGSFIQFQNGDKTTVAGYIALVKGDSLYVNGRYYPVAQIRKIILLRSNKDGVKKLLLYTTAGLALSTVGMTLAKWTSFKTAAAVSAGLGYGNFLIHVVPGLKRGHYSIGKKFSIQVIDLHF
jgi:hypothetical protein